jgi:DNA-binding NtrC family response regulator
VVITAYGTLQNAQEAIKNGIKDFLIKPFNIADILSSVNNILKVQNDGLRVKKIIHEINAIFLANHSFRRDPI